MKNPQFLSNFAQTFRGWPAHGKINRWKFEQNRTKIVDFLLMVKKTCTATFWPFLYNKHFRENFSFFHIAERRKFLQFLHYHLYPWFDECFSVKMFITFYVPFVYSRHLCKQRILDCFLDFTKNFSKCLMYIFWVWVCKLQKSLLKYFNLTRNTCPRPALAL